MSARGGPLRFSKMHGAGNDFVVLDRRGAAGPLPAALVAQLGDRRRGVGFDQLLSIEDSARSDCVVAVGIRNADGSDARQCGNGMRCVAAWLERDGVARAPFRVHAPSGPVDVAHDADGRLAVALPVPDFAPSAVPFVAAATDATGGLHEALHEARLDGRTWRFAVVSIGNAHAVVEVESVDAAPVESLGRALQQDERFPDRCNVGFAEVLDDHRIRLRVYERGAGETLACGSGACAAAAVLVRRGRVDSPVEVVLPGGTLGVRWDGASAPVWLSGPAEFVYEGVWQ